MLFWGARYTRSWITMLVAIPLLSGIYVSVLGGTSAWIALVPLTAVVIVALWLVPLSTVSAEGIRLVLRAEVVPWSRVASVLDPRPGDEQVRLELTNGRILSVPGAPPSAVPTLRRLRSEKR